MAETKAAGTGGYVEKLSTRFEEGAGRFMKAWKGQAKRPDQVGEVSYRSLELVHGGLRFAVRALTQLEKATQLPHRPPKPETVVEAPKPAPHAAAATHEKRPRHAQAPAAPAHRPARHERSERPEPSAS